MVKSVNTKSLTKAGKKLRNQYGALCYRFEGKKLRVLLITSRGTSRWVVPKGWPIDGLAPHESAAQEAWEEAGVQGTVKPESAGFFTYVKEMEKSSDLPCAVMVYPLEVSALARRFPEMSERRRKWFSPAKAAEKVREPELASILRGFEPA